ncbi:hypothetical protein Hanom_Chr16g01419471 [Helianthus anomalus]
MQPIRNNTCFIHEISNRLQYSFEIVLLRFPSHQNIKSTINIFCAFLRNISNVHMILCGIKCNRHSPQFTFRWFPFIPFNSSCEIIHQTSFFITNFDNFTSSNKLKSKFLWNRCISRLVST